jgi:hypothetical protein
MTEDSRLAGFIEKAAAETGAGYSGLYALLELYTRDRERVGRLLNTVPENNLRILERCKKHLALLRKMPDAGMAEEDQRYYYDAAFIAACFVAERTGCWNGLKPLLLAFRHTGSPLLRSDLRPIENIEGNIAVYIVRFLHREWEDGKMKALRRDMANDFSDYLKPRKNRTVNAVGLREDRQRYNNCGQGFEGFDRSLTEPDPLWRYAYIRALGDLAVDNDGGGRLLHNILDKTAENDPSPQIREWAAKTAERLRNIRGGCEEGFHNRRLIHAFWWMCRAHMQTLHIPVDDPETLRTRNTEYR